SRPEILRGHTGPRPVRAPAPESMSTFFRALERAEQERAERRATPAPPPPSAPDPAPPAPNTVHAQVPQSVFTAPSVFTPPRPATDGYERPVRRAERADELEEHLISLLAPASFEAEQYRVLRHTIEQLRRSVELSGIAVSSPRAADRQPTAATSP